jgi:hypothetical protein
MAGVGLKPDSQSSDSESLGTEEKRGILVIIRISGIAPEQADKPQDKQTHAALLAPADLGAAAAEGGAAAFLPLLGPPLLDLYFFLIAGRTASEPSEPVGAFSAVG